MNNEDYSKLLAAVEELKAGETTALPQPDGTVLVTLQATLSSETWGVIWPVEEP